MPPPLARRSSRGAAAVEALCRLGLPAELFIPALLEALHEVVPSYRNLFDCTDATGRLERYFIEGPVDEQVARHYFDEFHNRRESEAMPSFADLGRMPAGVRNAAELDHPAFFASALYHEIWRPQRFRWRIEAVLRARSGGLLGSMVMYRAPGDRPFTRRDEEQLAALLPSITRALDDAGAPSGRSRWVRHADGEQSMLVDALGCVRHATPGARQVLMLARGGITRERLEMPLELLAGDELAMLLHAMRHSPAEADPAPAIHHENAWGRFSMRASRLHAVNTAAHACPDAWLQVQLGWSEPHAVALERVLRRLPITPGQIAVCRALYRGAPHSEIAHTLGIAPSTVVDHVRKLYRSLELRSAAELRALLDGQIDASGEPR